MARGRPRKFDEDQALTGAMQVFWAQGLSATSLDDLAMAMQMNRPSIYNAFGGKEQIYRRALGRFCAQLDAGLKATLGETEDVVSGLIAFYDQAIEIYTGGTPAMGCLMICTAPAEALSHPEVGEDLRDLVRRLDQALAQHLAQAQRNGALPPHVQPRLAAKLLQATLHTLAIRARAGESRATLRKLARYAVDAVTA